MNASFDSDESLEPRRAENATPAEQFSVWAMRLWWRYDGKPIGGQILTVQKGALEEGRSTSPVEVRCDADGGATLPLTTPGIYHVQTRHRFVLPGGEARAESHTFAITLEVAE